MTTIYSIANGDTAPKQRPFCDLEDEATTLESNTPSRHDFRNEQPTSNPGDTMYEDVYQLSQEIVVNPTSSYSIGWNVFTRAQQMFCANPSCAWQDIGQLQGDSDFETISNVLESGSERGDPVHLQFVQINGLSETGPQPSMIRTSKRRLQRKLLNDQSICDARNTDQSHFNQEQAEWQFVDGEDSEACWKQGKALTIRQIRREKNRGAAAKCRQKQRACNQQKEESYGQATALNKLLHREQRELRNVKVRLQNALLAHIPGVCDCNEIHRYNLEQAQRVVLETQCQPVQPPPLPFQESESWMQFVAADASFPGTFPE